MLLAILATVLAVFATIAVIFANENLAAPSATVHFGWVIALTWGIAVWAWLSWIFS